MTDLNTSYIDQQSDDYEVWCDKYYNHNCPRTFAQPWAEPGCEVCEEGASKGFLDEPRYYGLDDYEPEEIYL